MTKTEKMATCATRGSLRMVCPSGTGKVPVYELEEDGQVHLAGFHDLNAEIQLYKDSCDIGKIVQSYALSGDQSILMRRSDGAYIDVSEIPDDPQSIKSWIITQSLQAKQKPTEKVEEATANATETDNQS